MRSCKTPDEGASRS